MMVPKPFIKGAFRWVTSDQLCALFRSSESKFSNLASRFCRKSDSLSSISFVLVSLISSSLSSMTFATIVSCALASICFSSFNNRSIPFVSQDLHSHTSPEVFDMAIKMLDDNPEQLPAWYHELHRICYRAVFTFTCACTARVLGRSQSRIVIMTHDVRHIMAEVRIARRFFSRQQRSGTRGTEQARANRDQTRGTEQARANRYPSLGALRRSESSN